MFKASMRGLWSGADCFVSGSIAVVRVYLQPLQPRQEKARFDKSLELPLLRGMICSTAKVSIDNLAGHNSIRKCLSIG